MNRKISPVTCAVAAALAAVSLAAFAQQAPKPEAYIKARQSAFQLIAWQSGRIKASLEGGYNKDEVEHAAATIAAIANTNVAVLFPAGTEQGKGWHDTSAKAEIFRDAKHTADLSAEFTKQANELAKVAAAGDAAQVKDQFAKLNRTCKACHDDFRAKD